MALLQAHLLLVDTLRRFCDLPILRHSTLPSARRGPGPRQAQAAALATSRRSTRFIFTRGSASRPESDPGRAELLAELFCLESESADSLSLISSDR